MELPDGVGWTALLTAYARARESARPDRLFDDPVAEAVIAYAMQLRGTEAGQASFSPIGNGDNSELWDVFGSYFVIRTPFYDAEIRSAVAEGCRQIVLLAAGFDGRAERLVLAR